MCLDYFAPPTSKKLLLRCNSDTAMQIKLQKPRNRRQRISSSVVKSGMPHKHRQAISGPYQNQLQPPSLANRQGEHTFEQHSSRRTKVSTTDSSSHRVTTETAKLLRLSNDCEGTHGGVDVGKNRVGKGQ